MLLNYNKDSFVKRGKKSVLFNSLIYCTGNRENISICIEISTYNNKHKIKALVKQGQIMSIMSINWRGSNDKRKEDGKDKSYKFNIKYYLIEEFIHICK